MREVDLLEDLERIPAADAHRRGRPLAHAVHSEDGGLAERRREEGARGVTLMVLGEQELRLEAGALAQGLELPLEQELLEELLLDPEGHGHRKGREPPRSEGEVCLQESLEFQERLVVEDDVVQLVERDPALA